MTIAFDDFLKIDIRVGVVVSAEPVPEAGNPAIKLVIEFGPEIDQKKSSAQIAKHHTPAKLVGRRVRAVVNFPLLQSGPLMSEALTLGAPDAAGEVVLIAPDLDVPAGGRMV